MKATALLVLGLLSFASPATEAETDLQFLQRLVAEGKANGSPVIRIPPRTYRIDAPWEVNRLSNTVLDGQGSLVLYTGTNWTKMPWTHRNHFKTTIRNLIVDYEKPPFVQGRISEVEDGGRVLVLDVHAGYPDFERAGPPKQMHLFDGATREWKRGTADIYPEKMEVLSPTRCRISLQSNVAETWGITRVGDLFAATYRIQAAFGVYFCEDLVLDRVTVRASPSLAFVIRYQKGSLLVKGCRVERGPTPPGAEEPRLMSSGADALNVAYLSTGMRVEDCDFAWMGDDSINIHGGVYPVLRVERDRVIFAKRSDLESLDVFLKPGARVRTLAENTFALNDERTVAAYEKVENPRAHAPEEIASWWPTFPKVKVVEYALKFAPDGKGSAPEVRAGDWIEFPDINGDGYVVRNNYFHDHRARCVRIQAGRGLIENNRFERIGQAGLSIGPEYIYWREAGWARDVIIRSNVFKDVGVHWNIRAPSGYSPGAISLFYRPDGDGSRIPIGNRNILIEGNRIDGCPVAGIHINASEDVTIRGNLIRNCNRMDGVQAGSNFGLSSRFAIVAQNSRNVIATNNRIESAGPFSAGEWSGASSR